LRARAFREERASNELWIGWFHADVELRRQGRPGLLQLVADLMQQDDRRLQLERIRTWMEANGLKDFYARSIAQPARFPEVDAALASVGFELSESEASLDVPGIHVEGGDEGRAGRRAGDERARGRGGSGGPAARADVRVGDEIRGCGPKRERPPRVGKGVATQYRFGLACIASGAEVAQLEVVREGEEMKVDGGTATHRGRSAVGFSGDRN
jgi:hypothetical protein